MKNINAKTARAIAEQLNIDRLPGIFHRIITASNKGELSLTLDFPLNRAEREAITEKGFLIMNLPSIAQQKDGDFHSIEW